MSLAVVRDLREARAPAAGRMSWRRSRPTCWPGSSWPGQPPGRPMPRSARTWRIWSSSGRGSAARCGTWSLLTLMRPSAWCCGRGERRPAGPLAGAADLFPVPPCSGRVAECPVDEMNRPRGTGRAALRIPPSAVQVTALSPGTGGSWRPAGQFAPGRPQLCGGPADGRGGAATRPATLISPTSSGIWAVREAARSQGQRCPRVRAPRAHGAADQRRWGDLAVVHRGCMVLLRR